MSLDGNPADVQRHPKKWQASFTNKTSDPRFISLGPGEHSFVIASPRLSFQTTSFLLPIAYFTWPPLEYNSFDVMAHEPNLCIQKESTKGIPVSKRSKLPKPFGPH